MANLWAVSLKMRGVVFLPLVSLLISIAPLAHKGFSLSLDSLPCSCSLQKLQMIGGDAESCEM